MKIKTADIVLGLQWGDEGKGKVTDWLVKTSNFDEKIVIRFSGGQQAGHNVVLDNGISHVHSNFGSGTLRGVPSYFSEYCAIYPPTIMEETKVLKNKGFKPKLYVHPLSKLTTPFDVIYNRIREKRKKHGTCGLGVGATMSRMENTPYKLYAIDMKYNHFKTKLLSIIEYYQSLLEGDDKILFSDLSVFEYIKYMDAINQIDIEFVNYDFLIDNFKHYVFEGSQGILLDMDHGFFPHVTYSNTTSKNAYEICRKLNLYDINVYYVTRCYQTRHGNGWMSNEQKIELINTEHEINHFNDFQKEFRIGELDYDLLNYSLKIDENYSPRCKRNVVVTCLDQRPNFVFEKDKLKVDYNIFNSFTPKSELC